MANYTIPDVGKQYLLKFKVGLGGSDLSGTKIHLAKDTSTFTGVPRDQTLGSLVEANFPGYAAQPAGPWGAVGMDTTNHWAFSESKVAVFTSTDNVNSFNIGGWYLTDAGGTNLIEFEQYSPVIVLGPLQTITVQIEERELSEFNN